MGESVIRRDIVRIELDSPSKLGYRTVIVSQLGHGAAQIVFDQGIIAVGLEDALESRQGSVVVLALCVVD